SSGRNGSTARWPGGTRRRRCWPRTRPPSATVRTLRPPAGGKEARPLSDDAIRLVTVGRMLRGRGRLLTALVVLGALVGLGASLVFPPRYSTSASVLLPGAWE